MIYDMPPQVEEVRYVTASAPTVQNYTQCAKQIVAVYSKGFQWGELVIMMQMSLNYMQKNFPGATPAQFRAGITAIMDQVITLTETNSLPEQFAAPIFEALVPTVVTWLFPDNYQIASAKTPGKATPAEMSAFVNSTLQTFSSGFQWQDLAVAVMNSIQFVQSFAGYTVAQQKNVAVTLVDNLIQKIDIPDVPDMIADPIIEQILNPYINNLVDWVNQLAASAATAPTGS